MAIEEADELAEAKPGADRPSVENPGLDAAVRRAPHPQQQIELEPPAGRVLRPELRHLDLVRPDDVSGHVNVLAHEREQAREEISVAEMDSHVLAGRRCVLIRD